MESLFDFLEPLLRLLCTAAFIVLFFLYIARPLLRYLFINYEIEQRKKRMQAMMEVDLAGMAENQSNSEEGKRVVSDAGQRQKTVEKVELGRLAASDPDKAGELVKKWANSN